VALPGSAQERVRAERAGDVQHQGVTVPRAYCGVRQGVFARMGARDRRGTRSADVSRTIWASR
jgi:hypothetical protein